MGVQRQLQMGAVGGATERGGLPAVFRRVQISGATHRGQVPAIEQEAIVIRQTSHANRVKPPTLIFQAYIPPFLGYFL